MFSSFWITCNLFQILNAITEYQHAKHRQLGYLKFHESTRIVRRAPFFVFCAGLDLFSWNNYNGTWGFAENNWYTYIFCFLGTLALLLMQTIITSGSERLLGTGKLVYFNRIEILGLSIAHEDFYSILVTIQVMLVLPFIVSYIGRHSQTCWNK